jgi:hypothetical protein
VSTGTEEITWDMVRQGLREISKKDENWAGCPLPITGIKLVIGVRNASGISQGNLLLATCCQE